MDTASFVSAMAEDLKLILITSGVILLLGMAGVVSLFWVQNYTRSRKLLQNTRAFAAEMIANLPEGIATTGMDGKVTFINSIAAEMLGVDKFAAVGQASEEIFPENLRELIISSGNKTGVSEAHVQIPVKDGGGLPIAASATEIVTEEGNFVGFMLILRDLSQIKRLQEEVQKKEKMAIIGNLAAGVAHEVRNPLSSIKGYATFFGSLFDEGSENRKAANVMTAEVERLNRVISELMEIARPSDIRPKETDLSTVLDTSLRLVRQ
jgi:two-component system sensor histidine kinase HydH